MVLCWQPNPTPHHRVALPLNSNAKPYPKGFAMRVLIVDHDSVSRRDVDSHLEQEGFAVTTAPTVAAAVEELNRATFDVALLGLKLHDGSGLEILRMLRTRGTPIHVIVLSQEAREDVRVKALELGADDFVVKPFFVRELTARVQAVQRRETHAKDRLLVYGPVAIELASRRVTLDNTPVNLTTLEFDLLAFLAARPGHAFSREELLRFVWKSSANWQRESTVTEHVRRLRAKIERDPDQPRLLQTVRGTGYRFDPAAADPPDPVSSTAADEPEPVEGSFVVVDGRIVQADEGAVEMLGVAREAELLGRDALELVAPQSLTTALARGEAHAAGFSPGTQIVAIRSPDGTDTYVEFSSSPTEWNGQPATVNTIRLRMDPGAALRHIVTGVVSEMSDAVIVTDQHFRIRSWNDAAVRFYGWPEDRVLGRRIENVLRFVGDDGAFTAARQTLDERGRWFGELSLIARDGSPVNVSCTSTVVRNDMGEAVLVVGVHRLVVAPPNIVATATVTADEAAIRAAIAHEEIDAYYQPIVALRDQSVVAVEASARWNHPDLGPVTPTDLIDPAEHITAIVEADRVTFERACQQTAIWRRTGLELGVAIHLSNAQLANAELFDDMVATLATSRLDPHALWLEVTETALVEDLELAADLLHRLDAFGVRVAVDNFGIGWASLAYLKQLPVHALKIDQHFVAGVLDDHQANSITQSILALGQELGLTVIAVGVDTAAQHAALQALGCELGQGLFYGPPTSAGALTLDAVRRR